MEARRPPTVASSLFRLPIRMLLSFLSPCSLSDTLVEMPARCFANYALVSKARPVQNFVPRSLLVNSLKSHYNKIPSKLLVDFVPRLLSRTGESVCRHVRVWGRKQGRKFHRAEKRRENLHPDQGGTGDRQDTAGKTGRSSENSSTLLRAPRSHISLEKNNGYFLPWARLSALVEMPTPHARGVAETQPMLSHSVIKNVSVITIF